MSGSPTHRQLHKLQRLPVRRACQHAKDLPDRILHKLHPLSVVQQRQSSVLRAASCRTACKLQQPAAAGNRGLGKPHAIARAAAATAGWTSDAARTRGGSHRRLRKLQQALAGCAQQRARPAGQRRGRHARVPDQEGRGCRDRPQLARRHFGYLKARHGFAEALWPTGSKNISKHFAVRIPTSLHAVGLVHRMVSHQGRYRGGCTAGAADAESALQRSLSDGQRLGRAARLECARQQQPRLAHLHHTLPWV